MAPKPPPAKGPAAGKPGEEKTPPKPPTKPELFLTGYHCVTLGIVLLFSLVLYTLWYISLCAVEKAKRDPIRNAVAQIRNYMISQNAEYDSLNDTAVILEAEKLSRQLLPWAEKIKELQAEIADLHYKLNHKWIAYNSYLYFLNPEVFNFSDSDRLCNRSKAHLAYILDDREEAFLEATIKRKYVNYFIGLNYNNREWQWYHTQGKALKHYWQKGYPKNIRKDKCALIQSGCRSRFKCWLSTSCSTIGRCICKKKPEDKWIN